MNISILLVEDDKKTVDIIRLYLEKEHYSVQTATSGLQALRLFRQQPPDLVILDLMLPQANGLDVCSIIRTESDVPVIMLTAKSTEEDKLVGLNMGADDYITKPFSPRELVARVKAVMRRTRKDDPEEEIGSLEFPNLVIDIARHEVRVRGQPIPLTPREFKLLETLAKQPGRVFSRLQLLEKAFGFDYEGLERTIDVHIKNLRKKVEPDPAQPTYILTVYGIGYKFAEE